MSEKCTVTDGRFVEPCKSLSDATEFGGPTGKKKGIFAWELHNLKEHKKSRTMFGVKSGEYLTKGVLFNYCPFCGEKIDEPFAPSAAKQEGEQ